MVTTSSPLDLKERGMFLIMINREDDVDQRCSKEYEVSLAQSPRAGSLFCVRLTISLFGLAIR